MDDPRGAAVPLVPDDDEREKERVRNMLESLRVRVDAMYVEAAVIQRRRRGNDQPHD